MKRFDTFLLDILIVGGFILLIVIMLLALTYLYNFIIAL